MTKRTILLVVACVALGIGGAYRAQSRLMAQEQPKYVGMESCAECHPDVVKTWAFTAHRRVVFDHEPSKGGCETCHGPGYEHVESGGDPERIVRPEKLPPDQMAAVCMKCHTQEHLTLWSTGAHAKAKLSCANCHDTHNPDARHQLNNMENAKLQLEGLSRALEQVTLDLNTASEGSSARAAAEDKVVQLKEDRDRLLKELKAAETVYRRTAEPYLCYNCHKAQEIQGKMVSHHPINEGKMTCADCHNPHGGVSGMLNNESINETCFRCHADKIGPFTYDHPPVSEDCTICHRPHGSVQNNLLVQSQPFLCLKCHAGVHSRGNALGTARNMAQYYTECTDCHNQVHGSDERASLRW